MKYFAYGSNMDSERMKEREVDFDSRKRAILKNYLLRFNKIVSANPKEGKANIVGSSEIVEGAVYDIESSDISKLDRVEGFPKHYKKKNVTVQFDDGTELEAVTYIAQPDKIKEGLKPTKEYLSHLLAGKDILSEKYYEKLSLIQTLD